MTGARVHLSPKMMPFHRLSILYGNFCKLWKQSAVPVTPEGRLPGFRGSPMRRGRITGGRQPLLPHYAPRGSGGMLSKDLDSREIVPRQPPKHQRQQERVDPYRTPESEFLAAVLLIVVRPTARQRPPIVSGSAAPCFLFPVKRGPRSNVHRVISLQLEAPDQAADARQRFDELAVSIDLHARSPFRLQAGSPTALGHNAVRHQRQPTMIAVDMFMPTTNRHATSTRPIITAARGQPSCS